MMLSARAALTAVAIRIKSDWGVDGFCLMNKRFFCAGSSGLGVPLYYLVKFDQRFSTQRLLSGRLEKYSGCLVCHL